MVVYYIKMHITHSQVWYWSFIIYFFILYE